MEKYSKFKDNTSLCFSWFKNEHDIIKNTENSTSKPKELLQMITFIWGIVLTLIMTSCDLQLLVIILHAKDFLVVGDMDKLRKHASMNMA